MSFKCVAWLVILAVPARAAPDCPLEKAHYVIRDEAGMSAGFQVRPAGEKLQMFFFVHAASRDMTRWFLPLNSRSTPTLVLITDITAPNPAAAADNGALAYSATDETGRTVADFSLQAGVRAPAHILIPRLQEILLYGFVPDSREGLSLAFLDLAGCDAP